MVVTFNTSAIETSDINVRHPSINVIHEGCCQCCSLWILSTWRCQFIRWSRSSLTSTSTGHQTYKIIYVHRDCEVSINQYSTKEGVLGGQPSPGILVLVNVTWSLCSNKKLIYRDRNIRLYSVRPCGPSWLSEGGGKLVVIVHFRSMNKGQGWGNQSTKNDSGMSFPGES